MTLDELAKAIHENADVKGFWPPEGRNFGEQMALIHSEISEALEEHRAGRPILYYPSDDGTGKPEGTAVELVDALIRTLDSLYVLTYETGVTIDGLVYDKMAYNATRPMKHDKAY